MPVTVESAHADVLVSLPSISAMTFCWESFEAGIKVFEKELCIT